MTLWLLLGVNYVYGGVFTHANFSPKIKTENELKTKQAKVLLLSLTHNFYWNLFFRLLFETIHRLELNTLKIRFAVHTVFYRQPCRPAGRCQTGTRNWIAILSIGGCCADPTPWSLRLGPHLDSGQGVKIMFLHWLVSLSSNFCSGLHSIHVQKSIQKLTANFPFYFFKLFEFVLNINIVEFNIVSYKSNVLLVSRCKLNLWIGFSRYRKVWYLLVFSEHFIKKVMNLFWQSYFLTR